jgi:hypothetical protein
VVIALGVHRLHAVQRGEVLIDVDPTRMADVVLETFGEHGRCIVVRVVLDVRPWRDTLDLLS